MARRYSLAFLTTVLFATVSAPGLARPNGDYPNLLFEVPVKPAFYRDCTLDTTDTVSFGLGRHTGDPDWFVYNPADGSRVTVHWAQFYSYPNPPGGGREILWMRTNCTSSDNTNITCQFTLSKDGGANDWLTTSTIHIFDENGNGILVSLNSTPRTKSPTFHVVNAP